MKFLVAYEKEGKTLVRIGMDNGEEKWMGCSKAVCDFAKKAFKDGEEVSVEYTEKNGQFFATRVTKVTGGSSPVTSNTPDTGFTCEGCGISLRDGKYKKCYDCNQSTPAKTEASSTGFTCADCGAELKNDKYKKCWTCNQKAPASSKSTGGDSQNFINRQNANHATSRTLIALQGHVDPNNVLELIDTIHAKYMEKITG